MKEARHKRLHTVWFHPYDIMEKQNYRDGNQVQGLGVRNGSDYKKTQGNFCSDGSRTVYICQNLLDCMLRRVSFVVHNLYII